MQAEKNKMKNLLLLALLAFAFNSTQAQVWEAKTSIPGVERHHPVTFGIDGVGYLVAGASNTAYLKDFYSYNPDTDVWTTKTPFPGPARGFAVGGTTGGKGYMGFGANGSGDLKDLWEYDPTTDTWTQLADCPGNSRFHPAFVAIGDKIYVGLGDNIGTGEMKDWWEYDIPTNSWSLKTAFPGTARHHPYYMAIYDKVYVGMGHRHGSGSGGAIYNDWYEYDPSTNTWTTKTSLPSYARVAGGTLGYGGYGFVFAGQDQTHSTRTANQVWKYEPLGDSWEQMSDIPSGGRWAPGSFNIGNKLYQVCGENAGGFNVKDLWVLELPTLAGTDSDVEENNFKMYQSQDSRTVYLESEAVLNSINLVDLTGRVVQSFSGNSSSLDLSQLSNGTYLIVWETTDKKTGSSKVMLY